MGWQGARRVVVMRRALQGEMLIVEQDNAQQLLGFIEADRKEGKRLTGYEYAVLVTNLDYDILALGQLYRDRADAENSFDELKNQWGGAGSPRRSAPLSALGARGGVDLQLVELVRALGQSRSSTRGHYQPAVVDVFGRTQN